MEEKEKVFEEQLKKAAKVDVKFITSIALAVNDIDGVLRHVQLTLVQETESKIFRAFMDVVDPSKIKLADVSESCDPA